MPFPDLTGRPLAQLISLEGRTAVVTGGGRGLGSSIARRLAEAGASVVVADIDEDSAREEAAGLAGSFGVRAAGIPVDVTDAGSVGSAAQWAVDHFGGIDVWVNNAGVYPSSPLLSMTDDDWDRVIAINLRGTFLGSREAARRMVGAGRGGVIVNLSSVAGLGGRGPGVGHYVASKHGVVGLTKQLALELAGEGIRVLAVAPTIIITPGVEAAMARRAEEAGVSLEEMLSGPGGRAGRPDDVARVVLFCASDLAAFMTGSTLVVDAGETAR